MIYKNTFIHIFLLLFLLFFSTPVYAQDQVSGPTYTIQPGDTLGVIAAKFDVSVDDIIKVNNIENPNILSAGQQIIIPGLEGVTGNLTAEEIPVGINLTSLSIQHQFPLEMLVKLNKVTSPEEIFAGSSLILPVTEKVTLNGVDVLKSGESILEKASTLNLNPWILTLQNDLEHSWQSIPTRLLFFARTQSDPPQPPQILPFLSTIQFNELPMVQGHTIEISAAGETNLQISGKLAGNTLYFYPTGDGRYQALQGVHAMSEPGLTSFELSILRPDSSQYQVSQRVSIQSGFYPEDPPLSVDPETIDPAYTKAEDDTIKQIVSQVTPHQLWSGVFRDPVDEPCYKSVFGVRRIYNGGQFIGYHGGLDFGVCAPNLNIYAPAAGNVVFTGPLTATGNATFIDHGRGIFTGYGHQNEIKVKVGDHVEPGQLIGIIGATGRVTGPHLHLEVWVNGVKVNPVQWLENIYP